MVQRRAARRVFSDYSPYSSVSDMFEKLGGRTLEQRRADSRLVLFYKLIYGYVAVPLFQHISYEDESISNQPNLFPVEIQLFFFNSIAL